MAATVPLFIDELLITEEACGQMDGMAIIEVFGGTPPYSFEWDGNPTLSSDTISDASAGLHEIVVTDSRGCVRNHVLEIGGNSGPVLNSIDLVNEACGQSNGVIGVEIVGGTPPYTYEWSPSVLFEEGDYAYNLPGGVHTLTVTDSRGCEEVIYQDLYNIQGPVLQSLTVEAETCGLADGAVSINIVGGTPPYHYAWSHDSNLDSNIAGDLPAGNYMIDVLDTLGCLLQIEAIVEADSGPRGHHSSTATSSL